MGKIITRTLKFFFSYFENPIVYYWVRLNIFHKNISDCLLALSYSDFKISYYY